MAGTMKSISAVLMITILVALVVPQGVEAIGCSEVVGQLSSCVPYLTNKGPLGSCCGGVKGLNAAAKTPADRQSVCGCLKSLSTQYGVDASKAKGLPGQCGVSIPYQISPNIDCSTVH